MTPARSLPHALLLTALFISSALAADPASTADKLDPKQIEVTLIPDKASILPGEPVFFTLTVKIKSAPELTLDRPLGLSVTDRYGRKAPPPGKWYEYAAYFEEFPSPHIPPLERPFPTEYTYRLFLPFSASLQKPGVYTVASAGVMGYNSHGMNSLHFNPAISIPLDAPVKLEVTQPDEKKLGEIIDNLVKRASVRPGTLDAWEAALALASIPDERVIPYFREALRQDMKNGWYAQRDTLALGQFNSDAALVTLKKCMETPASGKSDPKNSSLESELHANHLFAAEALAGSPHPGAIPYLLTRRNDPSYMVRSEIVRVLGTKVPSAQAIPLLQEMTTDKNADVRKEAKDCLKKLTAKSKVQSGPQSL